VIDTSQAALDASFSEGVGGSRQAGGADWEPVLSGSTDPIGRWGLYVDHSRGEDRRPMAASGHANPGSRCVLGGVSA
jgi:hypothetical protein